VAHAIGAKNAANADIQVLPETYAGLVHNAGTVVDSRGGGAQITIKNDGDGTYSVSAIDNGGAGYITGDTITIQGSALGGGANDIENAVAGWSANGQNDLVLTVNGLATAAAITLTSQLTVTSGRAAPPIKVLFATHLLVNGQRVHFQSTTSASSDDIGVKGIVNTHCIVAQKTDGTFFCYKTGSQWPVDRYTDKGKIMTGAIGETACISTGLTCPVHNALGTDLACTTCASNTFRYDGSAALNDGGSVDPATAVDIANSYACVETCPASQYLQQDGNTNMRCSKCQLGRARKSGDRIIKSDVAATVSSIVLTTAADVTNTVLGGGSALSSVDGATAVGVDIPIVTTTTLSGFELAQTVKFNTITSGMTQISNMDCIVNKAKFDGFTAAMAAKVTYTNADAATGGNGAAEFDVTVELDGTYTVTVATPGTGYADGDTFVIKGTALGGTNTINDLTLTVRGDVNGIIAANELKVSGTAPNIFVC
jgi:hypothetical protein